MLDLGDTYSATLNLTDPATGNPVAGSNVALLITLPDASTASPAVTNPTLGSYAAQFVTTQAGQHSVLWSGDGFAQSDVFNVSADQPGLIISLDEARRGLGMAPGAATVKNDDLRTFILAATPIMEDLIGAITPTQRTETYDGGSAQIALIHTPVLSVASVIETQGSNYQRTLAEQELFTGAGGDYYGYTVDLVAGIITRRANGIPIAFLSGQRNVRVVYTSGRVLRGNQLLATRRLVRWMWDSEQQGQRPQMGEPESVTTTPSGYTVPLEVVALLGRSRRLPGVA